MQTIRSLPFTLIAAGALVLGACGAPEPGRPYPGSAEEAFYAMENRLIAADPGILDYRVTSSGAFTADIGGEVRLDAEEARLTGAGSFGGQPVDLRWERSGDRLAGGNGPATFEIEEIADLEAAVVLGITRMGILHNLARLTSGAPPDHANGAVREWIQPVDVAWTLEDPDGAGPIRYGFTFGLMVDGVRSAEVELWLDGRGLPVRRDQTVQFPGGEMIVVEEYSFELG